MRLKVRPVQGYDDNAYRAGLVGGDVVGAGHWRLRYRFKTGAAPAPWTENSLQSAPVATRQGLFAVKPQMALS